MAAGRKSDRAGAAPLRAQVVVMGDFGRSPRMQYHALSLAQQAGMEVDVVAFEGSTPIALLTQEPKVHLRLISPPPTCLQRLPRPLTLVCKALFQVLQLLWVMLTLPRADFLLLQNPPCIPTFTVCQLVCSLRRTRFVIDWHNFGFSLMAITMGKTHPLVKAARWYEQRFGKAAYAHLCVTGAMREELVRWGIDGADVHVVHDYAASFFKRATLCQTHELFLRLRPVLDRPPGSDAAASAAYSAASASDSAGEAVERSSDFVTEWLADTDNKNASLVTEADGRQTRGRQARWRADRPAVIVSSTSWTCDEDFSLLLEAAKLYDVMAEADAAVADEYQSKFPRLLILVTGKGPQRASYEAQMRTLQLKHVAFRTLWLSFADYTALLGSADLGVCLHTSSSGLDLPMKVVDMFGCQLPVCAVRYSTIHELVAEGYNGLLFDTSTELLHAFMALLENFPSPDTSLAILREGAVESSERRWDDNWARTCQPVFTPPALVTTA